MLCFLSTSWKSSPVSTVFFKGKIQWVNQYQILGWRQLGQGCVLYWLVLQIYQESSSLSEVKFQKSIRWVQKTQSRFFGKWWCKHLTSTWPARVMPLRLLPRTTGNAQDVPTTGKQTNQPKNHSCRSRVFKLWLYFLAAKRTAGHSDVSVKHQ